MSEVERLTEELRQAVARGKEVSRLISETEASLVALNKERRELQGEYYTSGRIAWLREQLAKARRVEETARLSKVRVLSKYRYDGTGPPEEWGFVKRTTKRIYLRRDLRDEFFDLDGRSGWGRKLPEVEFRVEVLEHSPDPFLIAKIKTGSYQWAEYYIEVWDEPDFEREMPF